MLPQDNVPNDMDPTPATFSLAVVPSIINSIPVVALPTNDLHMLSDPKI